MDCSWLTLFPFPMRHTLSKSDFTLARTCATKLYYREMRYPSTDGDDPFLALLADGGYMVEELAKLLVPNAIDVDRGTDIEGGAEATRAALRGENVALLEATFLRGAKLARVDILIKRGRTFELIEVKSGGCDSRHLLATEEPGVFRAPAHGDAGLPGKWKDYLTDVAYQVHLLREELGDDAIIRPMLQLPDKAKTTSDDLIHRRFSLRRVQDGRHERLVVEFTGDPAALRAGEHFLSKIDVSAEVAARLGDVTADADALAASLVPEPRRLIEVLDVDCGKCEFRTAGTEARSGFHECWGALGTVTPHILELHHVGSKPVRPRADALIQSGRASLFDVTRDALRPMSGELSARGERQWIQIEHTRLGMPWIGSRLRDALDDLDYPLHFIDFEASRLAVPYHAGMHPWEIVAFQWSCHRVSGPGAPAEPFEWINVGDVFPNQDFVSTLRERLGAKGTVLTWGRYEIDVLNEIARQGAARGEGNATFDAWRASLTNGRWLDMHELCLKQYFHPAMRGSTSIKDVLDALWASDTILRAEFPEYGASPGDPYDALPKVEIDGRAFEIAEGTGAVTAYQAMLYGEFRDNAGARGKLRDALLRYCRLDTAAMVMIWNSWGRAVKTSGQDERSIVRSP